MAATTPKLLSSSEPEAAASEPAPPSPISRSLKTNPSFVAEKKSAPEPVLSRSANSTPSVFKLIGSKDKKEKEKKKDDKKEKKEKKDKDKHHKLKDKKPLPVPPKPASEPDNASALLAQQEQRRPSAPLTAPAAAMAPAPAQRGKSLPEVPPIPPKPANLTVVQPTVGNTLPIQTSDAVRKVSIPDLPTGSGAEGGNHADDVTARNYDELPSEMQKLLGKAKISKEKANADWVIVVAILEFHLKKKFTCAKDLYADEKELQRNPQLRIQIPPEHPFHLPQGKLYSDVSGATKYTLGAQLGQGGFGVVFSATKSGTTEKVAVKKLPNITSTQIRHNGAEVALMRSLNQHANVAHLIDAFQVGQEAWLVMELIEGGAVTETCKRYNFEEPEMAYVAEGMLQAIQFLHKNKVLHRDLKSANLMMTTQAEIKLIDFGLCCALGSSELKTGMVGSPFWMSPEMIRHEPYSYQTDIWSFGITMLELANRVPPNSANLLKAMYTTAKEGCTELFLHPKHWSTDCKDFITKSLTFDAKNRPLTDALLKHPFLKKSANQKHMKKVLGSNFLDQTLDVLNM